MMAIYLRTKNSAKEMIVWKKAVLIYYLNQKLFLMFSHQCCMNDHYFFTDTLYTI